MAKKQRKARGNGSLKQAKLPAGFTNFAVGGGFGAWWEHQKQKVLQGKIVGFDSYLAERDGKKVKRGIMRVDTGNGVVLNVGESSAIRELFDPKNQKTLRGKQVFIQFLGQDTFKKGRETRKINRFQVAVK